MSVDNNQLKKNMIMEENYIYNKLSYINNLVKI